MFSYLSTYNIKSINDLMNDTKL